MLTLDEMRKYVCGTSATVVCPVCADAGRANWLYFDPLFLIHSDFNPEISEIEARVELSVLLNHRTCRCVLSDEDVRATRNEAYREFCDKLKRILATHKRDRDHGRIMRLELDEAV